ncbi:MAG: hypothetical protein F6K19_33850 [Cyanothece sp. SIO1E1]|nr:hypothetical protein [Cyanothece sp. SIO1E1]
MAFGKKSSDTRGTGFATYLLDFSYNPLDFWDWVKLGCQVTFVATLIVLGKALDGTNCDRQTQGWLPQTWPIRPACFVRSLLQNVPDDFLSYPSNSSASRRDTNLVAPPQAVPTPAPDAE